MKKSVHGFSLIEVMVVASLVAGIGYFVMTLMKNTTDTQKNVQSKAEELAFTQDVRQLIYNVKHCRLSLAGDGTPTAPSSPVKFFKDQHDDTANATNGLPVELFLGDQNGLARSKKKFSASTGAESVFGPLRIKSIKLFFTNGTGTNYLESTYHTDMAQLVVVLDKKMAGVTREVKLNFDLNIELSTDASQETTILGCSNTAPAVNVALTNCYDMSSPSTHNHELKCNNGDLLVSHNLRNEWGPPSEWHKHQYMQSIRCCKGQAGSNLLALQSCVVKTVLDTHNQTITCDPDMVLTGVVLRNEWGSSEWYKHQYVRAVHCCRVSI